MQFQLITLSFQLIFHSAYLLFYYVFSFPFTCSPFSYFFNFFLFVLPISFSSKRDACFSFFFFVHLFPELFFNNFIQVSLLQVHLLLILRLLLYTYFLSFILCFSVFTFIVTSFISFDLFFLFLSFSVCSLFSESSLLSITFFSLSAIFLYFLPLFSTCSCYFSS